MLFDLRSPHRRRVVKVVYVFLALLIGVGLVGFGIGNGSNFGGLFTASRGGGSATGQTAYTRALTKAQKQANATPDSPTAWINLGKAAYTVAVLPTNYLSTSGYSKAGHAALDILRTAWQRYLALAPANPSTPFAQEVAEGFSTPPAGVGDYKTTESAWEVIAGNEPTSPTAFEYLAYYSWLAGNTAQGNAAAAKAKAIAPKSQLKQVETTLSEMQTASGQTGATSATGATGASGATGG